MSVQQYTSNARSGCWCRVFPTEFTLFSTLVQTSAGAAGNQKGHLQDAIHAHSCNRDCSYGSGTHEPKGVSSAGWWLVRRMCSPVSLCMAPQLPGLGSACSEVFQAAMQSCYCVLEHLTSVVSEPVNSKHTERPQHVWHRSCACIQQDRPVPRTRLFLLQTCSALLVRLSLLRALSHWHRHWPAVPRPSE